MEDVWSVSVYQHAVMIELVKCISCNVFPPVDHRNAHTGGRASLCDHAARKSSSHNKNIGLHAIYLQRLRGLRHGLFSDMRCPISLQFSFF